MLHLDGRDLRPLPLRDRKRVLRAVLDWEEPLRFTQHRNTDGEAFWRDACRRGWEGVIAKRASSRYRGSRSRDWLEFKCVAEQELVVGGFTDPEGGRVGFGALLVGYWEVDPPGPPAPPPVPRPARGQGPRRGGARTAPTRMTTTTRSTRG